MHLLMRASQSNSISSGNLLQYSSSDVTAFPENECACRPSGYSRDLDTENQNSIMNISLQFRTCKNSFLKPSINRSCNERRGDSFRRIWKLPESIAEVSKNSLRTSPQQPAPSIIPIDLNLEPTTFKPLDIIHCQWHQSTAALPRLLGFKTFSSISQ